MKRTIRAALFACAAIASLAFAGSALASFAPKLVASSIGSQSSGGATRVGVLASNADDPTAKVSIYVPAAYTVATATFGKLGDVTATAAAADLGGAVLPLTGELDAIPPTATTNDRRSGLWRQPDADVGPAPHCSRSDVGHPAVRRRRVGSGGRSRVYNEARRLPAAAGCARRHAGTCDVRREAAVGDVHLVGHHAAELPW